MLATKKVFLEVTSTLAPTNLEIKYLVEKSNYILIAASKPIQNFKQFQIEVNYKNRKLNGKNKTIAKIEQMEKKILFLRNQKS